VRLSQTQADDQQEAETSLGTIANPSMPEKVSVAALFSSNLQANLHPCGYRKQSKMRRLIDAGAAGRARDGQGL
jgi:hypothetical protein